MTQVHKVMTLYTKIKTELLLRDEKIEDLLRDTKLSPATLSNLKKSRPRRNTYDLLAEYLGLELIDLMLLPITREEIIGPDPAERFAESDYDVIETVEKSKILPLEDGQTMKTYRQAQMFQEMINEVLADESRREGREVTWDEYRQRIFNERSDS